MRNTLVFLPVFLGLGCQSACQTGPGNWCPGAASVLQEITADTKGIEPECASSVSACPPPKVEVKCPDEIRVKAPPQKVVVNVERRPPEERTVGAPVSAPQEVILVPRTVYVPYAAQTPVGPVRMVGLDAPPALAPQRLQPLLGAPPECRPSTGANLSTAKELDELNQRLERLETALQRVGRSDAECAPQAVEKPPASAGGPFSSQCLPHPFLFSR